MNARKFALFVIVVFSILGLSATGTLAQPPGKPDSTTPAPAGAGEPAASATPTPLPVKPLVETTPSAPAGVRLDLAAMALDSTAMPAGYVLFYEVYVPGNRIAADLTGGAVTQAEVDATGLEWFYESVYVSPDGNTRIRSYVEQYADADGAVRGFDLLENEQRFVPASAVFTDEPGAGVGEQPSEISVGSLQPSGTPMEITSVDSTFRSGALLAGVGVDTIPGTVADKQVAIDLSRVLFDRIQTVLANQPLALIDYALPGQMVTLGPDWRGRDEGYLAATEIFGAGPGAEVASSYISGYFTNETLHSTDDATLPVPIVSVNVSKFQDESAPLQMLNDSGALKPPFDGVAPLEMAPIPGASVTQGLQYANPMFSDATNDSVRVVMVVGDYLVIIDIQANKTLQGAIDAATQIAAAQAACLQTSGTCPPLQLPAGLLEPPNLPTPTPAPAG